MIHKHKCISCREQIKSGAKKCIHCNSFQNWRRFVVLNQTVLALLVALISVTAIMGPVIIKLFDSKETIVDIRFIGSDEYSIKIAAINSSNSNAYFSRAHITIYPDTIPYILDFGREILIESKKDNNYDLYIRRFLTNDVLNPDSVILYVEYIDLDESYYYTSFIFSDLLEDKLSYDLSFIKPFLKGPENQNSYH